MSRSRRYAFQFIAFLVTILCILLTIKLADYLIVISHPKSDPRRSGDINDTTSILTMDFYPYSGGHTQANADLDRNNWSGDHGFFVDFDLDRPPVKGPDELRLILTGGSGAVGWGANSNFKMLYRRLERKFNETRPCGSRKWLRVINLAMGGSESYQNFIMLNRWGHALDPDLILSYSGHNDFFVPLDNRSDAYVGFRTPASLIEATRFASSPDWLKALADVLPGFLRMTDIGLALRILGSDRTQKYGPVPSYTAKYPAVLAGPIDTAGVIAKDTTEQIAVPMYSHAMASIARDFPGTPILVVSQAYMWPPGAGLNAQYGVILPVDVYQENYRKIFAAFKKNFIDEADPDGQFHFLDFNAFYTQNLMDKHDPGDGVHLNGAKAAELTEFVADRAFRLLCAGSGGPPQAAASQAKVPVAPGRLFPGSPGPDLGPKVLGDDDAGVTLTIDGQAIPVHDDAGSSGMAEQIAHDVARFRISGWAVDRGATTPPQEVVLLAEGHLIGQAKPGIHRQDLAEMGQGRAEGGWEISVPYDGTLRGSLSFYALMADGTARQLDVAPDFSFAADRPGR